MTLLRNHFQTPCPPRAAILAGLQRTRAFALLLLLMLPGTVLLTAHVARAAGELTTPNAASPAVKRGADVTTQLNAPLAVSWKYTGSAYAQNAASPVSDGDTIYFASGTRIYAVNVQTGALKWRYPAEPSASMTTAVQTTPAVSNNMFFFGTGDGLYALDATEGKLRWHYTLKSGVNTSPAVVGNTVYFGGQNGHFYGIDTQTGNDVSAYKRGGLAGIDAGGDVGANFAVANGTLYYLTSNQVMHAMDLATGLQQWVERVDLDVSIAKPVISGESLYLAAGNTLSSWRLGKGQRRWLIPLPNNAVAPPAVDANGTSYVITADRYIYAVDTRGRGIWHQAAHVDYEVNAQPILAGNLLIVGTAEGGVYAFDTATGKLEWSYVVQPSSINPNSVPLSTNVAARPAIVGDTLCVLSDDGTLTAFRHDASDTLPPDITIIEPERGDALNGRPPFHIAARIKDEGSGLNLDTLRLQLDSAAIPRRPSGTTFSEKPGFVYNPDDGTIEYYTMEKEGSTTDILSDGLHTATVTVQDWMGNVGTKSWSFIIDDSLPRRVRRNPNQPGGTRQGPGRGGIPGGPGGGIPGVGGPGGLPGGIEGR